ncbi:hypothetical protein ACFOMD_12445 [Sphingoaurantiacus capsulatus]|uniref:Uncharacterized protein n=1 Tax=Sphingoaurantiacus capsulatus TaxID=1771310 RepID=A0ABV7XDQ2_9SPHN
MTKPPETPPSSDIDGVHRDRVDQRSSKTIDAKAQAQAAAEKHENVGRPKPGPAN